MGIPSVFPTGVTIYNPEKCWNGYTLLPLKKIGANYTEKFMCNHSSNREITFETRKYF